VSLTIETHDHGEITILTVEGELDLAAVPAFEAELHTLASAHRVRLVIDLRKLTFCDSTGLDAFVRANQACAKEGGWLRLAAPQGSVRRVLEITGLMPALTFDSVDRASGNGEPAAPP
jgi:anti-sigma B factor antagonist